MPHSADPPTRRGFLAAGLATTAASLATSDANAAETAPAEPLMRVDYQKLVSRADLIYEKPVPRSEEGMPIGNGRMGTLVWTTPTQIRFQINRADVYGCNSAGNSFFERHTDYCGGCAFADIDFHPAPPFPEAGFRQRLSVYDGVLSMDGDGVRARLAAWPAQDVIAIRIEGAPAIARLCACCATSRATRRIGRRRPVRTPRSCRRAATRRPRS